MHSSYRKSTQMHVADLTESQENPRWKLAYTCAYVLKDTLNWVLSNRADFVKLNWPYVHFNSAGLSGRKKNGVVKNKQCETMRWLIQSFLEDRVQFWNNTWRFRNSLKHRRAQVGCYFHGVSHCLSLIFLKNEIMTNYKQEFLKYHDRRLSGWAMWEVLSARNFCQRNGVLEDVK